MSREIAENEKTRLRKQISIVRRGKKGGEKNEREKGDRESQ